MEGELGGFQPIQKFSENLGFIKIVVTILAKVEIVKILGKFKKQSLRAKSKSFLHIIVPGMYL